VGSDEFAGCSTGKPIMWSTAPTSDDDKIEEDTFEGKQPEINNRRKSSLVRQKAFNAKSDEIAGFSTEKLTMSTAGGAGMLSTAPVTVRANMSKGHFSRSTVFSRRCSADEDEGKAEVTQPKEEITLTRKDMEAFKDGLRDIKHIKQLLIILLNIQYNKPTAEQTIPDKVQFENNQESRFTPDDIKSLKQLLLLSNVQMNNSISKVEQSMGDKAFFTPVDSPVPQCSSIPVEE